MKTDTYKFSDGAKMQRNIKPVGENGYCVEFRYPGDRGWTTVYCGASWKDAIAAFRKLKK
jgi:hypothetical protein